MVVDDRKELLTRAEIMNRVYLRDIAKLDAEIQRLDRILAKEFNSSVSTLDDVRLAIAANLLILICNLMINLFCDTVQLSDSSGSDATICHVGTRSRSDSQRPPARDNMGSTQLLQQTGFEELRISGRFTSGEHEFNKV